MKALKQHVRRIIENFYLVIIMIFLYAPILTMMVLSFNSSKSRTQWGGFTTRWYVELFQNATIMDALYNTLLIAFVSSLIATVIGTAASIAINHMKPVTKTIVMGVTNVPMLNADIVTGISLMLTFLAFGISLGFETILISHITFNIPYVILSVMPKLKQTNQNTFEAAMDLGASPIYAFFKVIFPDILPGILSGFLLAFTMSLDDFIITHFTKEAINTLSTLIYSEVRRGIKPSMYALSTIIFLVVLVLLLITNFSPEKKDDVIKSDEEIAKDLRLQKIKHSFLAVTSVFVIGLVGFTTYQKFALNSSNELYVYNWGEYIDEEVITQLFEEETGIQVTYDLFETNEEMYPVIEAGAVQYDVVCPSDYMIQKMAENGLLLAELNYDNIPNISQINPVYLEKSRGFDPENKYSVPYCWGTVGILYNTSMVALEDVPDEWSDLWDEKFKGEILMQDSV